MVPGAPVHHSLGSPVPPPPGLDPLDMEPLVIHISEGEVGLVVDPDQLLLHNLVVEVHDDPAAGATRPRTNWSTSLLVVDLASKFVQVSLPVAYFKFLVP